MCNVYIGITIILHSINILGTIYYYFQVILILGSYIIVSFILISNDSLRIQNISWFSSPSLFVKHTYIYTDVGSILYIIVRVCRILYINSTRTRTLEKKIEGSICTSWTVFIIDCYAVFFFFMKNRLKTD